MDNNVFRLHQGTNGSGWFSSANGINKEQLNKIKTSGKEVATSIPSPFARIDLVKTAFKWVTENGIHGDTSHHKLVSDALDVAQLFFTSNRYKKVINIVAWDPIERLDDLIQNGNGIHAKFAETLKLFWNLDSITNSSDSVLYNFEHVKRLYFLILKETGQVIGGTSPISMFLASPDVRHVMKNLDITIADDRLFDDKLASLDQRESSFVEYIYAFSKQPNFASRFPEVYGYLEEVRLNHIKDQVIKNKISQLNNESINKYDSCNVLNNSGNPCEILGFKLGILTENLSHIEEESDFLIKSDFEEIDVKPLVLPFDKFTKQWTYTTRGVYWNPDTNIDDKNVNFLKGSILPIQNNEYEWLSRGNLLADKIIQLPYPIDDEKFITCGSKNYLLPLTPTFFKYFDSKNVSRYLTVKESSGGNVNVELKIPVRAGEIIFNKTYTKADKNIENLSAHLAIFPFIKSNKTKINYKIGIIDDRPEFNPELQVNCYHKGVNKEVSNSITRNPGKEGIVLKSMYFKIDDDFDALSFGFGNCRGFIVPNLKSLNGSQEINFAVDFGTTNTHIEYQVIGTDSMALDNDSNIPLWQSLLKRNEKGVDPENFAREITFNQEILPYSFPKGDDNIKFPVRTALVHNKDINFQDEIEIISQINNYLFLEKRPLRDGYLELYTDLKWSNYSDTIDERKVESYIEFIVQIIFYKTLLLDGDVSKTTLTWFYPVSMDEGELNVFNKLWKKIYEKVFNQKATNDRLIGIPESISPYLYYKSRVTGLSLSIDIGGGSSDLAVFDEDDKKAKLISSIKFAGNSIFGDGFPSKEYRNNSDHNGFVKAFKQMAIEAVKGDEQREAILTEILKRRKNSADFSSYLFALENELPNFKYSRLLERDKRLKLTIFIFYAAISYYAANLLKKSNIVAGIPKNILLSGTAAKTALIIDSSDGFKNLSSLFQFIFQKVNGVESGKSNIEIQLSPIPKEITCKGALKAAVSEDLRSAPIKFWIGGNNENVWGQVCDREKDVHKTPKYSELINNNSLSEIEASIKDFYKILDEYVSKINLDSKFTIEINAYNLFKQNREDSIKEYIQRGVKAYYKKEENYIEESVFFYPLVGLLNKLANDLSENT